MSMKKYARVQNGIVAELLVTEGNISEMFAPGIIWVDASSVQNVTEGWLVEGGQFVQPTVPEISNKRLPTLTELRQQLAFLEGRIAELEKPADQLA